jgi:hypothetical protein
MANRTSIRESRRGDERSGADRGEASPMPVTREAFGEAIKGPTAWRGHSRSAHPGLEPYSSPLSLLPDFSRF